jgi:hypothetical protein
MSKQLVTISEFDEAGVHFTLVANQSDDAIRLYADDSVPQMERYHVDLNDLDEIERLRTEMVASHFECAASAVEYDAIEG